MTDDGRSSYPAVAGRYHLYVSLACPWAHRTIIVRKLKRLEHIIGMTVVDPIRDGRGWAFRDGPGHSTDPVNGFTFLSEAYAATDLTYRGRVTVPVLWDTVTRRIVSNSDNDIMRMFNRAFNRFTESPIDLYPDALREPIDELNAFMYETVNNGVYRAVSPRPRSRMNELSGASSTRWVSWRPASRNSVICSAHTSSRPTGDSSSR